MWWNRCRSESEISPASAPVAAAAMSRVLCCRADLERAAASILWAGVSDRQHRRGGVACGARGAAPGDVHVAEAAHGERGGPLGLGRVGCRDDWVQARGRVKTVPSPVDDVNLPGL